MPIKTKYHGEIEINMQDILHFEKGIPGFLEEKEFIILPLSDDQTFSVMQSVVTEYLAFVITSPFHFFQAYDFQLEDSVVEELGLKTEKEVQVISILTIEEPFERTTANLQAPIIINTSNQKAKQVILNQEHYKTKHPIFQKG
ncbi:flagellar assembly protein FliW [Neobacillus sp. PS3-40]|uniref:flagellar assembly protein FliW n=1 Tax=Neobacillus sp. PS3-40 TaxID=3070679 RepID=UPI0027E1D06D|nr:flagellar assembly protein FliW [Neobacillus sp. PS3-40]WML46087.1 flagellar assembly protein FliW [Neobacillus sp. PS3-40]